MNKTKGFANYAVFNSRGGISGLLSCPMGRPAFFGQINGDFINGQPQSVFDAQGHPIHTLLSESGTAVLTSEHVVSLALEAADPLFEVVGTSRYERDLRTGTESYTVHGFSLVEKNGDLVLVFEELCLTILPEEGFMGIYQIVWDDFSHSTKIGTYSTFRPGGTAKVSLDALNLVGRTMAHAQ